MIPVPTAETELKLEYIASVFPAIQPLIEDPTVTEIMAVSRRPKSGESPVLIFFEKQGQLFQMPLLDITARDLKTFCYFIARPLQMDPETQPMIDARLGDGSRVALCVAPATPYPALTIRRFGTSQYTAADLVAKGSLPQVVLDRVTQVLQGRGNILVAGGTGSGKTTLLNAFIQLFPMDHRLVVVEDTLELKINQPNTVRLEARALSSAAASLTPRDMVRHSLRHRPDHIVVGELRGAEALDALQALNTGHGGSLTTIHANSARDALQRVASCAMQAPEAPPWDNLCLSVCMAFHLVIYQSRLPDGSRGVCELIEVGGYNRSEGKFAFELLWSREAQKSAAPVPRAAALTDPAPLTVPAGFGRPEPLDPARVESFPPPPRFGLPSAYLIHRWWHHRVAPPGAGAAYLERSHRPQCIVLDGRVQPRPVAPVSATLGEPDVDSSPAGGSAFPEVHA